METQKLMIHGDHSGPEEDILIYLYNNPEERHSTDSIASRLEDATRSTEEIVNELKSAMTEQPIESNRPKAKRMRKPEDVQRDVESLLVKGLIQGRRQGTPGHITHTDIQLTQKGEREAIVAKDRVREIICSIPRPPKHEKQEPMYLNKATMHAGNIVREARLNANVTQADLARRLNMTQTGISRMEKREKVGSETLEKVAQGLGLKLEIRFLPVTPI